jgi:hypothetical protein
MSPMVMVLVGFIAGLMTMTVVSLYKWVLKYWNEGV